VGCIRVLDDHLVNRIAAGEVVERPASVLKELVENALDAGSSRVDILVEAGGKRRVRVSDDGCGMDRDDALLALERHATSKLKQASDLEAIETLGFRGEALPSIAAVSRLLLRTASRDGEGTEIEVRGGRIQAVREAGLPRGTTVEVAGLFFNVPARRKFLRSDATELSHTLKVATRYALARPDVRFRVDHGAQRVLDAPAVTDPRERIAQVHGRENASRLLPFSLKRDGVRAGGFAGRPSDAPSRRDPFHLFVNGRLVTDRMLSHAVAEAYGDSLPRGRFPMFFLFLEIPAERVDVNVHPQKTEVRFSRSGDIHDLVRDAVASALAQRGAVPSYRDLRPSAPGFGPPAAASERVEVATLRYLDLHERRAGGPGGTPQPAIANRHFAGGEIPGELTGAMTPAPEEWPAEPQVVALAQYRDCYIVARDAEGLLLVDQHVAHERVLYERYLAEAEENRVQVQRLMFPVAVELPADERVLAEEQAGELRRLGFLVEPFGGDTVRLDGVPSFAAAIPPERLLRDVLGEASRIRSAAASVDELRRSLVTTAACKAAVKLNDPLSLPSMQRLLEDLFRTVNPTTCPHGRPIMFRLTLEEIERAFRRR
jgi:DNA mismatch repair protein MutL